MFGSFNERISLFQRLSKPDKRGGKMIKWEDLGKIWASLVPKMSHRPAKHQDDLREIRCIFDVIVRDEPRVFLTDKVVWNNQDLIVCQSPEKLNGPYLRFRVCAFSEKN